MSSATSASGGPAPNGGWFRAAALGMTASMSNGIVSQIGLARPRRGVHRTLYAASVAMTATVLWREPHRRAALVPAALALTVLPRTRGGTSAHALTAAIAAASYMAAGRRGGSG